ncbi:hypothetical protein O1611_g1918 [Lasiodiplodia mahajangana]|uniref:Uncharacterized protein n=1 Tax=Lasiodiplodia mahajangana TaxID=1108764 RepID=A0ACC2JW17_9PEZI|nr:hypothetical protein O1611_g1918 [Lasiodiplodia mahajangana]
MHRAVPLVHLDQRLQAAQVCQFRDPVEQEGLDCTRVSISSLLPSPTDLVGPNTERKPSHAARFLVRVLRFSWENDGEWSCGKFDPDNDEDGEGELEFYQVWAILQYLQAEWEAANVDDWEMERLTGMFTEMTSRL